MKLIYLHQYFSLPHESGGTRSYDLAASFVKEGFNVTVVTATSNDEYKSNKRWTVIETGGIKVHYIYMPYGNHFTYWKRSVTFFKFLWYSTFRLLKIRGDMVLATSTPLTIGIPALVKKWIGKTPFVFEVRDVWPEAVVAIGAIKSKVIKRILYGLEELIYSHAAGIVPLSTDMQKSIVSRYPQFKDKAKLVIENIAELNRFQSNKSEADLSKIVGFQPRFSVLYAGTFGKVNGIQKVVELASQTIKIDGGIVYILVGAGAEKERVKQLAKDKSVLDKNVFILDPIPKNELPWFYNAVSMGSSFVINIPALWANSANKFFDTLAAMKPVLINHEGWQAEVIRARNVGYVLPVEVTEHVARDFVSYSQNEELIAQQRINAGELAREMYSLEVATANYLKVFNSIK